MKPIQSLLFDISTPDLEDPEEDTRMESYEGDEEGGEDEEEDD